MFINEAMRPDRDRCTQRSFLSALGLRVYGGVREFSRPHASQARIVRQNPARLKLPPRPASKPAVRSRCRNGRPPQADRYGRYRKIFRLPPSDADGSIRLGDYGRALHHRPEQAPNSPIKVY
jgi:hypothetical protein